MHSESDKEKLRLLYGKYKNRMYITACKVLGARHKECKSRKGRKK